MLLENKVYSLEDIEQELYSGNDLIEIRGNDIMKPNFLDKEGLKKIVDTHRNIPIRYNFMFRTVEGKFTIIRGREA